MNSFSLLLFLFVFAVILLWGGFEIRPYLRG